MPQVGGGILFIYLLSLINRRGMPIFFEFIYLFIYTKGRAGTTQAVRRDNAGRYGIQSLE